MPKNNEKKFYETSGIDWNDEESIREFARQVWANFVAQSDFAGADKPELKEVGEPNE